MTGTLRRLALAATLLASVAVSPAPAEDPVPGKPAEPAPKKMILVELFTSQG